MKMMSGAAMVVEALKDVGVTHVFGYPGGAVLDIYDALYAQEDVEHVLVRHEQAAAHMADGYARSTGKTGTVLVTSGPGATNTITGIATAYMDSIPMVVLSGQVPSKHIGEDAFQETDMVGCSRPIVKHSFLVKRAVDIPEAIAKAYYIANTGRPGPVVVDLPKDIVNVAEDHPYVFPTDVTMRSYNPTERGHTKQIKKAVASLMKAERPVLYVGGGAVTSEASSRVIELAEKLNAPVTCTLMGLGAMPGTHEQFVGMLGMHGTLEANKTMHNADCIIALGARFDDRVTNNVDKFCPHADIIHVDIDPASISKTINAHIPVVGSVDKVLDQILEQLVNKDLSGQKEKLADWWQQITQWRSRECLNYEQGDTVIKPQQVIESIYKHTNGEAYVSSDVGQHQMFAALYYPFDKPRQWINSGGLGTMGFGLPAAMGVQFAHPDSTSVVVTGDGSIQMNIQELSTCLQYNLPIKIITLNNRALGMVRQWQDMIYKGRHSHSYMDSMPDFVKLAESYGHVGIKVDKLDELDAAMEKCFSLTDRLVFMDIAVDQNEHVYPMQIKFGAMDDMRLSKTERT
ncbi:MULTISPECIES: acetolactate synthase 3 large subunit [Alteromonas]|uniref:Acetolactate synthase n=1 Tax=Alteromonas stellipolaris TaxID=233316 RepID=A0AAW7Z4E0_9ALTE|nr:MULTISPECIES: acetolactate synthase 3 large subunit [Alteromonas]AMJ89409.1 acetolactate synthase 3 catalytic subunit [Alteromonas sp. Mac2]ALM92053.1 Acetolactate synthase large subunit [Alteromonas stellipolaris LMG 21856]AMJ73129.1 acetolactate synthase 3 catalytic subunit [Alteromonas stellipolaris]AMJ85521.1 acetolactate synthase 3 catalytic subunit [Alteromonas sp. Mac1]AMJ93239.1 acetolactate synthase 3 catalytic subunit [Alteromonas stellipolaris]